MQGFIDNWLNISQLVFSSGLNLNVQIFLFTWTFIVFLLSLTFLHSEPHNYMKLQWWSWSRRAFRRYRRIFFSYFHGFRKQSSSFSISCWLFTSRVWHISQTKSSTCAVDVMIKTAASIMNDLVISKTEIMNVRMRKRASENEEHVCRREVIWSRKISWPFIFKASIDTTNLRQINRQTPNHSANWAIDTLYTTVCGFLTCCSRGFVMDE